MKVSIKKTEMYMSKDMSPLSKRQPAGEAYRPATIADTYGMGKPTRTNPIGGFMAMQCFSGSPDQKKSPTTPGVTGFKKKGF
jgi:hypothetical protein